MPWHPRNGVRGQATASLSGSVCASGLKYSAQNEADLGRGVKQLARSSEVHSLLPKERACRKAPALAWLVLAGVRHLV
jgi:hypothetical protein